MIPPLSTLDFRLSTRALRGFTLVEVLVSIGIFTVLTGVVLSNYRGYNTNALFANASEDIVLALRQAQVYGVGVKGTGTSFTTPYGVYFSTVAAKKNEIVIFADTNGNRIYNPLAGETAVETIKWNSTTAVSTITCDGVPCGNNVYVTFKRPNPDAFVATVANQAISVGKLDVVLNDSNTGKTSTISITSTGQISLQ